MFGYVTVFKELMNERDYLDFTGYYCGLCKAMGKNCSQISRMGLSYDITFLAIILSSVSENQTGAKEERCILHPLKKRKCFKNDIAVEYAANMGVLLDYLKLKDDWNDERSIKALIGMICFHRGMRKAKKRYYAQYKAIEEKLLMLSSLEKENCKNIDKAADCFAKILEVLFTPDFIENADTKRILAWLGYNTGRWIYIIDAINDMADDYKNKSYNPFNEKFCGGDFEAYRKKVIDEQKLTLTFTLENMASSFELLETFRNRSILEHIIYKSLMIKQNSILESKNESV